MGFRCICGFYMPKNLCPLLCLAKVCVPRISCLYGTVHKNPRHHVQNLSAHGPHALSQTSHRFMCWKDSRPACELPIPILPKRRESQRRNTTSPPKERGQVGDHNGVKGDPTTHGQPSGTQPRKGHTRDIVDIADQEPVDGTKRPDAVYDAIVTSAEAQRS